MVFRPHPRYTTTDSTKPEAWATCDKCGFIWNHPKMDWQFDWRGTRQENLRILTCPRCMDNMQRQLGVIILPPDPDPILHARPENYSVDETGPFQTTIASAAAIGTTQITVVNTSGFATNNLVIVALDSGQLPKFSVTVSNATTLVLNGPLLYTAAIGNYVSLAK